MTTMLKAAVVRALIFVISLAAWTSLCPSAAWAVNAFQESAGQVVIDAEHYDSKVPRNSQDWVLKIATTGYAGSGYLEALPNTGISYNTGYVTSSPELVYNVQFATTGTYYVWVRGIGATGSDDSLHAGLDGTGPASADRISGIGTTWNWKRDTMDAAPATLVIASPGLHTIYLWMREDGLKVDKILLRTSTSSTAPSGTGPAESPRITLDTTPPVISGLSTTGITSSGATITWTTNETSTSQANYGPTTAYGQTTALNSTLVTSHSVALSGLTASTLYHYRVRSKDVAGNEAVGTDAAFTTALPLDTTPPTGSVTINGGAVATNNRSVTLTLSATDNSGTVTQMQCSNDGATFAAAQPYATSAQWTLTTGDGQKTVYVKFKDAAGNWSTPPSTATITLDTTPPQMAITSPLDGAVITAPNP